LDKIVTCRIPQPKEEPDLHELIMKLQEHRHKAGSCDKGKRTKGTCRFGFPRPVQTETTFKKDVSEKEIFKDGGRPYDLKRTENEKMINNYNPILLAIWGANMDIQPVGNSVALAYYIAKYVSKDEPDTIGESI